MNAFSSNSKDAAHCLVLLRSMVQRVIRTCFRYLNLMGHDGFFLSRIVSFLK